MSPTRMQQVCVLFEESALSGLETNLRQSAMLTTSIETPGIVALDRQYKVLKRLGEGSYGVVVAAQDRQTMRKVAIKKISGSLDDEHSAKQVDIQLFFSNSTCDSCSFLLVFDKALKSAQPVTRSLVRISLG